MATAVTKQPASLHSLRVYLWYNSRSEKIKQNYDKGHYTHENEYTAIYMKEDTSFIYTYYVLIIYIHEYIYMYILWGDCILGAQAPLKRRSARSSYIHLLKFSFNSLQLLSETI